jgi:Ran GTPase-activating protein (RanGAP) involved in mRNA processing and transport
VIVQDDKSDKLYKYKVKLADGATTGWLYPKQLASSGLDAAACRAHMDAERLLALDGAVQALRDEERAAVAQVRERVGQDRLPLLSLLQVEPLQMQSAHLSFQEFFSAQAICSGKYHLLEGSPPPWQWPLFWANAVTLGSEMGDGFGRGLLRAAGVMGDTLDLSQKLGGDPPTVQIVLAAMMKTTELKHCSLLKNRFDVESATMLAKIGTENGIMLSGMKRDQTEADFSSQDLRHADSILIGSDLQFMAVLTTLHLYNNNIGDDGAKAIAEALKVNVVLTTLGLSNNNIGPEGAKAIADALKSGTAMLSNLELGSNNIGPEGAKAIVKSGTAILKNLELYGNNIGDEGAIAIAKALQSGMAVLTTLWLHNNQIGDKGAKAIADALKSGTTMLTTLYLNNNGIGDDGAEAIAGALSLSNRWRSGGPSVLTSLILWENNIGDEGAKAIAEALKANTVLTKLVLWNNSLGTAGGKAVRRAVKGQRGFVLEL